MPLASVSLNPKKDAVKTCCGLTPPVGGPISAPGLGFSYYAPDQGINSSFPVMEQLLIGLTSADKSIREKCEQELENNWANQPNTLFPALCMEMSRPDVQTASLAAIIFRRYVGRVTGGGQAGTGHQTIIRLWHGLDQERQEQCCTMLLDIFARGTTDRNVRNKVADAIAEVARVRAVREEGWPQLVQLLWSPSLEESCAICALRILTNVPEAVDSQPADIVCAKLGSYIASGQIELQVAAIKALHAIATNTDDNRKKAFIPLLGAFAELLPHLAQDEEALGGTIQVIIEMVDDCPKLFRGTAPALIGVLIRLMDECAQLQDADAVQARSLVLELLTTLCEAVPTTVRKNGGKDLISAIVMLLLREISTKLSEDPSWYQATPDDDNEEEALSLAAEQALDRVSVALEGKALLPTLMGVIPEMLRSSEWKHRYAALRAIANFAEGCVDLLTDKLGDLLAFLWPAFQDPHPRVQYAACHALGQLCTDFAGNLQENHAPQCLNSLVGLLQSSPHPRVQAHAAAALVNFAEGVDIASVASVMDSLLERLVALLATKTLYLQEQVIATIAAFSGAAGPLFSKYHHSIVPLLMGCISSGLDRAFRLLQCRALEAATLIAMAVGKAEFAPFSEELLKTMVELQQNLATLENDDPMLEYLPSAWVRMCQVLGDDFAQFTGLVVPELLERAAAEPDIAVLDAADADAEDEYDPKEWEFATVRGKRLGIHTATLDAKAAAIENLAVYVHTLQQHYSPYAQQTFQTVLPLVRFEMHEGVQTGAVDLLTALTKAAYQAALASIPTAPTSSLAAASGDAIAVASTIKASMALPTVTEIVSQLDKDCDAEFVSSAFDALADLAEIGGPALLPDDFPVLACQRIDAYLTLIIRHQSGRGASSSATPHGGRANGEEGDDDDDIDAEVEDDDDETIMYGITRLAAALFKHYGVQSLQPTQGLLQFCLRVIREGRPSPMFRHACMCIIDDLIKHLGQQTAPLAQYVAECLAVGLRSSDDPDVRQAAIFGIGLAAEQGASTYESFVLQCLPELLGIIEDKNAKAPSTVLVTDNAMSAIARICQAYPGLVDPAMVVPRWIKGLPVTHDEDEAPIVYSWLIALLSQQPTLVLGAGMQHAPLITKAILEVLLAKNPLLTGSSTHLRQHLKEALEALQNQMPADILQSIWSAYTAEQLAKLSN